MRSWHASGGYLVSVVESPTGTFRAETIEDGNRVVCRIENGRLYQESADDVTAECHLGCAKAVVERKQGAGYLDSLSALNALCDRFGVSKHPVGGEAISVQRESNGDFLATLPIGFNVIAIRMTPHGQISAPMGESDAMDYKLIEAMRLALRRRLDWELAAKMPA